MRDTEVSAMESQKSSRHALETIARGAGMVAATGLAAAAGWAAYSALFLDHKRRLPKAIEADRYATATPLAGRMVFYADESAQGRPLLLLHSINAAASSFEVRPLFEYFRGRRPVFALDLPGFGFSERADRAYLPDLYVEAILEFVEGELANSAPVDVAALSLSCEFAALASLEQPELFRSLVFIAPTGFSANTLAASERVYRAASFPIWSQAFYDLLVTRRSIRYFLQKAFAGPVDPELEEYDYLTAHQPGARHAPLHFISGRLFTPGIRDLYAAMPQPVLAFPDLSDYGPSEFLPRFTREHPNWRMEFIDGTKAMPHFERTAETLAELESFFQSQDRNADVLRLDPGSVSARDTI